MSLYLKLDLSVYKMSCMRCWLPSNSFNSVIYQNLSSFQVYIELFPFSINAHARNIEAQKFLQRKFLESFDCEKVKEL